MIEAVAGGTYFFTVNLAERKRTLLGSMRRTTGGGAKGEGNAPISYRCHGDLARSPARIMDIVRG
jgi:hypothetical protein